MTDTARVPADVRTRLRALLERAHCPYSGFPVAVIIRGSRGMSFEGVNVESAAFPTGFCAEKAALGAAVTAVGRTQLDVRTVWIATPTEEPTAPCGSCRQLLSELAPDARVVSWAVSSDRVREWAVPELLPDAFDLSSQAP